MTMFEEALGPTRQASLKVGPIEYHERGAGRPIVFVHGLGVHAGTWRKVVPALADDHHCITPTLPLGGHRLPMRRDADLSPTGIAELIGDFLAALDLRDVVLVANDTGGAFAQIVVTTRPDRVGALVLTPSDAFEHFPPSQLRYLKVVARIPGAAWQTAQLTRMLAFGRSRLVFGLLTKHGIPDDVLRSYFEPVRRSAGVRRDLTKEFRAIHKRYTLEAAKLLPGFDRPALVAWARDDRLFPLDAGRRLAELLPDSRLELIDDSYSFVQEDQPEQLVAVMRDFLAAGARRRSAAGSHV